MTAFRVGQRVAVFWPASWHVETNPEGGFIHGPRLRARGEIVGISTDGSLKIRVNGNDRAVFDTSAENVESLQEA